MRGCARAEMKPAHVHTPTRTRKSPRAGLRSEPRRCYRNRAGRCPRTRRRTTALATPTRRPRLAYVPVPLLPEGQLLLGFAERIALDQHVGQVAAGVEFCGHPPHVRAPALVRLGVSQRTATPRGVTRTQPPS